MGARDLHPARLAAMRDSQMLLARLYRREALPREWISHAVQTASLCSRALVRLKAKEVYRGF